MEPLLCPLCGTVMERVDVPRVTGGEPRLSWAVPCGHSLPADVVEEAWQRGDPPVHIEAVTGVALVAAERARQHTVEGHTTTSDVEHPPGYLAWLAWCYLDVAASGQWNREEPPSMWPADAGEWKPGPTNLRNKVKAAAIICADIDADLAQGVQP